jgi:ornithine cyclodeaminase/alanine dehydrogenase-like protein (mu-crystallin family)
MRSTVYGIPNRTRSVEVGKQEGAVCGSAFRMALQDVAAAAIVYERAVAAGRGTAFDFAAF